MIIEFEKEYLSELYHRGQTCDKKHRYQPQVIKGFIKCVIALADAEQLEDLFRYNSLNYEKLSGNKKGLSSLRINNQYRLEFREIESTKGETIVTICSLIDITNHYK
ncbi:hypothetical protein HMPREF1212_00454 [Parabacteroides sp. HGS0025]|jgi:proteic killer suppression protein|uniref:type II toxin-antitoxin system RelE/ParE family toxin n=1 Tax=Parabacteroides sp. HGS0025 TaxID=1078087 RepID=UPI0006173341|nr:type II toxin-antitoxin system RelE/ParE family toxin [Parabacteroides sp. HGS0025]KKB52306.1 hypothetical protein HMPREF1212_00454 [Parabacteroides sp. HGS0025]